ncbi:hypothetical protein Tco_0247676 [Tanacetum coccineum]
MVLSQTANTRDNQNCETENSKSSYLSPFSNEVYRFSGYLDLECSTFEGNRSRSSRYFVEIDHGSLGIREMNIRSFHWGLKDYVIGGSVISMSILRRGDLDINFSCRAFADIYLELHLQKALLLCSMRYYKFIVDDIKIHMGKVFGSKDETIRVSQSTFLKQNGGLQQNSQIHRTDMEVGEIVSEVMSKISMKGWDISSKVWFEETPQPKRVVGKTGNLKNCGSSTYNG